MLSLTKILVPVAFSTRCRGAARYAAALASHFHAEITLLHTIDAKETALGGLEPALLPPSWIAEQRARVEERLEEFFTEELASVVVHRAVVLGDPAPEIVRRAHAEVFDLIVMPTHGYGPFRRLLLGSVTAKVLHDADCPVLTGPHMEQVAMDHAVKFQKIVCALDLGPHSPAVLEWAAKFSQSLSAELAIVHALTIGEARVGSFYFDPDWRTQLINSARSRITYLCENAPVLPQVCVETGDAPHVVAGVARRIGADLVIIGRSSAPGIAGRLRENAYAIVRGSPCAVLSV